MMKTFKNINLLLLALPILLYSCLKEQEDIFPESASARMSGYLENVSKVLVSSDEGWVLNYFPDRTQAYGGYAYTMKFDGQNVSVKTQLDNGADTFVSTYKLTDDNGPVLSFDTYNEAVHFFARPTASRYEAYDGDFEFIVMDVSDDQSTITLKGKRTGNTMYMYRLTVSADDYLASILSVKRAMPFQAYQFEVDGTTVYVDGQEGNLEMTYTDNVGEHSLTVPYIFTPNGMEFYRTVRVLGQELLGVSYVEKPGEQPRIGDEFPALGNPNVRFRSIPQKINLQFIRGSWYIAYSTLGEYASPYWNVVNRTLTQSYGEQLYYAYLGNENGGYGLQFVSTDGSQYFVSVLYFEYGLSGDDEVTLAFAGTGAGEAAWYYQNANFAYALYPFGYMDSNGMKTPRTFKLTVDNLESPSQMILTEIDNPENSITLWAEQVFYPFEN